MKKRIIPLKNYIIFSLIALLSFTFVYNLAEWYKDSQVKERILTSVISEVLGDEFNEYVVENSDIVVYMASSLENLDEFEEDFRKLIIKDGLQNDIIYFDTSKYDIEEFYKQFHTNYFNQELLDKNIKLEYFPNLVVFKDHKVTNLLYSQQKEININDVISFFDEYEVIEK